MQLGLGLKNGCGDLVHNTLLTVLETSVLAPVLPFWCGSLTGSSVAQLLVVVEDIADSGVNMFGASVVSSEAGSVVEFPANVDVFVLR